MLCENFGAEYKELEFLINSLLNPDSYDQPVPVIDVKKEDKEKNEDMDKVEDLDKNEDVDKNEDIDKNEDVDKNEYVDKNEEVK